MDTSRKLRGSGLPHPNNDTTNAHASACVSWQLSIRCYSFVCGNLIRNEAY